MSDKVRAVVHQLSRGLLDKATLQGNSVEKVNY
jgi:hypothetical protein